MVFENVTLILPEGTIPEGRLRVEDGLIRELGPARDMTILPREEVVDGGGAFLCPGLIDLHVHGALERDAMEAVPDAFETILRFHASGGTTSLALTSVAAPQPEILRLLEGVKDWKVAEHCAPDGATLLGIHVEGPYFSPAKAGAHRPEFLRVPTGAETETLLPYADIITQMTLAPELPGALELIDTLRSHGIIVSGGHSDAWDEEARTALERGMEQITHLYNAMSSARRRGPYRVAGLLEFALSEPRLRCELIADGHHVSPTLLRMAYQAKGAAGICLITDASPGAGLAEGSRYRFAEQECVVRDGVCLTADGAALSGSRATMAETVRNMVRLAEVPLTEAVRMATLNPARALRLDHERGPTRPRDARGPDAAHARTRSSGNLCRRQNRFSSESGNDGGSALSVVRQLNLPPLQAFGLYLHSRP